MPARIWNINGLFISFLSLDADKAPAAIVGLVGHKEYEQCAKDLYFFLQVSIVPQI